MAVMKRDLGNRKQRRRTFRAKLLDELTVAGITLQIPTETRHADPDDPPRHEDAPTFREQNKRGREREVLDHMLEKHRVDRGRRKWHTPPQIPDEVRVHAGNIDTHPSLDGSRARAEVQPG